jgi:hypothetical protein
MESWLGRGWRQRTLSAFALILALLLALGSLALWAAVESYKSARSAACSYPHCPPSFSQFSVAITFGGLVGTYLLLYGRIRYMERRYGIWFRALRGVPSSLGIYIRRPGVTPEAAAAALTRYVRGPASPTAQTCLLVMTVWLPYWLVAIGLYVLAAWLPTQWIPT